LRDDRRGAKEEKLMTAVRKRTGSTESFDRNKIARSLHNVGVDEKTASEIAALVQEREGMTTDDIRTAVSAELRRRPGECQPGRPWGRPRAPCA
jgi:2-phosphoglycerate kinase